MVCDNYRFKFKSKVDIRKVIEEHLINDGVLALDKLCKKISIEYTSFFIIAIFDSRNNKTYILTDLIRSYSLQVRLGTTYDQISLDDEVLVDRFDCNLPEYLASGTVSGNLTLSPKVITPGAGEILILDHELDSYEAKEWELYSYTNNMHCLKEASIFDRIKSELENCIDDLICYAKGKTIVLPLSGGLDSRLIAMLLHSKGYRKVICFTYGKRGNWEAEISERVATRLEYEWHFIEYNSQLWNETLNDKEFYEYIRLCGAGSSTPHIQDWPSIKYLKSNNIIPNDSIIVPGHSTDFLAGSHLEPDFFTNEKIKKERLIELMKLRFFQFSSDSDTENESIKAKIDEFISCHTNNDLIDCKLAAQIFEKWDIKERQAKFIVNSTKAYGFFDLDCYIPMWKYSLYESFYSIPFEFRKNKKVYIDIVEHFNNKYNFHFKPSLKYRVKMKLYNISKKHGLYSHLVKLKKTIQGGSINRFGLDNMGWYSIFDDQWLSNNYKPGDKFYSLMSKFYLDIVDKK